MEAELKSQIIEHTQKGEPIEFGVSLGTQGGPEVIPYLNNERIGKQYSFNMETQHWEDISGIPYQVKLGEDLVEWVWEEFRPYLLDKLSLTNYTGGLFQLENDELILKITEQKLDDEGEHEFDESNNAYLYKTCTRRLSEIEEHEERKWWFDVVRIQVVWIQLQIEGIQRIVF